MANASMIEENEYKAPVEQSSNQVLVMRDKVARLEEELKHMQPAEIRTTHWFSKGIYARELFIPKGTVLTGKIHKEENLNIISQGDISVLTEDGIKRIKAPFTLVSPPGTKRVGYAHEDTVWTTIHASEERDLDTLETIFIAKTYDEVDMLDKPTDIKRITKET